LISINAIIAFIRMYVNSTQLLIIRWPGTLKRNIAMASGINILLISLIRMADNQQFELLISTIRIADITNSK